MLFARGLPKVSNQTVGEALQLMKMALGDVQSNLSIAHQHMKCAVGKKRQNEEYKVDDEAVLSTANLRNIVLIPYKR